jgi:hypothetical protein
LLYVSRWASAEAASEFAGVYAESLRQRYKKADEQGDPPHPRTPEANQKADDDPASHRIEGRHLWSTEEGTVVIEQQADTVFISESLDPATTSTLEKEVFPAVQPAH